MMRVRDIAYRYDDEPVLAGVSFDVASGDVLAVMGANGSGKTTLLRVLAGLREPDGGTVETDEVVGYAPADPRAALFARTVAEEVEYFPRNRGLDAEAAAVRAMGQMDVVDLAERSPLSLSFGEMRRVAIAAVLAGEPAVVALDEPTAGLDRPGERRLGQLLSDLEAAVVLSTHAGDFAYEFADRVAVLSDGELEHLGPAGETMENESILVHAGIRPPDAVAWARHRGFDRPPGDVEEAVTMVEEPG